ncbi:MAG: hypothetical protein ACRD2B_05520 [Terriglobia bacterium]
MDQTQNSIETAIQKAFSLLIQIREKRHANRLLELANTYLHMLANTDPASTPVVVSVRSVRIREP